MANYTPNYQLHQWEPQDPFLRTDFNQDLQKIDTALDTLADKSAALEAAVALCGNCKTECISYSGNGSSSTTISFVHKPLLFLIQGYNGMLISIVQSEKTISFIQGVDVYFDDSTLTWSGNQAVISGVNADYQMNKFGQRYWVLAFYQEA